MKHLFAVLLFVLLSPILAKADQQQFSKILSPVVKVFLYNANPSVYGNTYTVLAQDHNELVWIVLNMDTLTKLGNVGPIQSPVFCRFFADIPEDKPMFVEVIYKTDPLNANTNASFVIHVHSAKDINVMGGGSI